MINRGRAPFPMLGDIYNSLNARPLPARAVPIPSLPIVNFETGEQLSSFADLAVHAAVNTKVKSTGGSLTLSHVGKVLSVTGGVNWTTGQYKILPDVTGYGGVDSAGYFTLSVDQAAPSYLRSA